MHGVSTRSVDDLIKAIGMTGISKSQVSRLCEEIDEKAKAGALLLEQNDEWAVSARPIHEPGNHRTLER